MPPTTSVKLPYTQSNRSKRKTNRDAKAVTIDKPQWRRHSIAKEIEPLSCTRRCVNGIVLMWKLIIMYAKLNYTFHVIFLNRRRATFRLVKSLYPARTRTVWCNDYIHVIIVYIINAIIASYCLYACLIKTLIQSKRRAFDVFFCITWSLTSTIKTIPLKHRRVQESGPIYLAIELHEQQGFMKN